MNKNDIISLIEKREKDINKSLFKGDSEGYGVGQFREIASICSGDNFYEEILLLIQHNIAKDKGRGKSWSVKETENPLSIGEIVIDCMNNIKDKSTEDDLMKNLSLFFGYMYWKARIWSSQNANETSVKRKKEA